MKDALSAIQSFASVHDAQAEQLRSSFIELGVRIRKMLPDPLLFIRSDGVTLATGGDGSALYGYLSYSNGELSVAYRSTEEDEEDALTADGLYDAPTYHLQAIAGCSFNWLRIVSQPSVLESLWSQMLGELERQRAEADAGIRALGAALNAPIMDAEVALEVAASRLGYSDIPLDWRRAQTSIYIDPAEAITKSSSLIESVLKHILATKGVELPNEQTIQKLLKPALKELGLATEDLPNEDLKNMSRGISTVVQNLGALRTHVSTAHGRGPGHSAPDANQARFAVDVAGALATFLMNATRKDVTLAPTSSTIEDAPPANADCA